jgi:phosphomevalonate kinase
MASNINDLRKFISESVCDIDIHLKAAGYDMFAADRQAGTQTLELIRSKVKEMEEKSKQRISNIERSMHSLEHQLRVKDQRNYHLEKANERLTAENNRLKQELDDFFPTIADTSILNVSMNASQDDSDDKSEIAGSSSHFGAWQDDVKSDTPDKKQKTA